MTFLTRLENLDVACALFDLDGTLVDSIGVHIDSHFAILESIGAVGQRHEVEESWRSFNWNTDTLYHSFGSRFGIDQSELVAAHVEDMYSRYQSHVFSALPGACAILRLIKESGLSVAVVTSSGMQLARIALETSQLDGYVDELVSREQTDVHKPNPEPYKLGLHKLGVSATQAVAFEDSWDGLRSAIDAGIFTFYLGNERLVVLRQSDLYEHIESLVELV